MNQKYYFDRVDLLLSILPDVMQDERIALKGGTALNLFILDMPRLSVDVDLTYVPLEGRENSLQSIDDIFLGVQKRLKNKGLIATLKSTTDKHHKQIVVEKGSSLVKIEINHVLRGSVHPLKTLSLSKKAQDAFSRYMDVQCLSLNDLYAGKICAALDRKHPRDLFDMYFYLKNYGYSRELHQTFLVYLISGSRPISELIRPNPLRNFEELYNSEFLGMLKEGIELDVLADTFDRVVGLTSSSMTDSDKEFLMSFKEGKPKWNLLPFDHIKNMPAIMWKLHNIQQMDSGKHKEMLKTLEKKLT
jgi:hypothetical protein